MLKLMRFSLVGLAGTLLDFLIFSVVLLSFQNPTIARALAYLMGTIWAFFLNRNWVFNHERNFSRVIPFLSTYGLTGALAIYIQYLFEVTSNTLLNSYIGYFSSVLMTSILNFLFLNIVFRNTQFSLVKIKTTKPSVK